ncbi:MAG: diguanylate cyclase [Actinomycetota bacterium]|nr:diguanylate cyclase [Actinomycetota bacterium]
MASVSAQINRGQRLNDTLQAVAEGVVEGLGFGAAAVNYVLANGDLQVLAVAGPQEARDALAGRIVEKAAMDDLLARSEVWGPLRFVPHEEVGDGDPFSWVPDVDMPDAVDAWHPEDALLAPLDDSDGTMVGLLSVDLPPGQRRPGPLLRELLDIFAVQAGVAIGNARLVEQLREEQHRLLASEAAFRFSFSASAGAMAMLRLDTEDQGGFIRVNDAFSRVLGFSCSELADLTWYQLMAPGEGARSDIRLQELAAGQRRWHRYERQMVRKDGTPIWAGLTATVIATDGGHPSFLLVHLEDITERKTHEDTLFRQAQLDSLTGVPNRRVLLKHLRTVVADAAQSGPPGAVLYCDLDGLKQINDRYGHGVGDLVLKETVGRLRAQVRSGDVIARLGGDEFVIVAVDLDPQAAAHLVDRIQRAFSQPLADVPEVVTISVGAASFDGDTRDVERLLHRADMAMYANKGDGRPT